MQSAEHPSVPEVLPSSQTSEPSLLLSPQTGIQVSLSVFGSKPVEHRVQESGVVEVPPLQMYPASIVEQSAEHPSVSRILLSSQVSPVTLNPSPQTGIQVSLSVFGVKPVSQAVQVSGVEEVPPEHM